MPDNSAEKKMLASQGMEADMKIEKLDRVVVAVNDLDKAKQMFSRILGISFQDIPDRVTPRLIVPGPSAPPLELRNTNPRVAISASGLELLERAAGEEEGIICFHFKVSDYEAAKAEMEEKELPILMDITLGKLREAIYRPDHLRGAMMGLVWYPTATPMEAIKAKVGRDSNEGRA